MVLTYLPNRILVMRLENEIGIKEVSFQRTKTNVNDPHAIPQKYCQIKRQKFEIFVAEKTGDF